MTSLPARSLGCTLCVLLSLAFASSFTVVRAAVAPTSEDASANPEELSPPIDYARPDAWLARPGLPSPADQAPKGGGFSSLQEFAHADVFYIHPTTAFGDQPGNAPINDPAALARGLIFVQTQATAFNAVARVFAPRYRQEILSTYDLDEDAQQAPANHAHADVRRAFEYYIAHDNDGRPFFLVGHSQGANHAQRLLSEVIQGTPLQARLVAAYLPGQPLPRSVFEQDLTLIPPGRQPAQTGCVLVWGTFAEGEPVDFHAWEENAYWNARLHRWMAPGPVPLVNINPVSWAATEPVTPAARHRGAVPFGVGAAHFTRPHAHLVAVRDSGRYDFVSPAPLPADLFNDGGVFGGGNYHVFDLSLFWLDVRENARLRLVAWLRQHGSPLPLLGSTSAATAKAGRPFRFQVKTSSPADKLDATGLPSGLALDAVRGLIVGTPDAAGIYAVRLTATNAAGADHGELALTVEE